MVRLAAFETFLPTARRPDGPRIEEPVGLLSLLYVASLLAFAVVGPFVVSGVAGVPFVTELQRVVLVAGVGCAVGMAILLR